MKPKLISTAFLFTLSVMFVSGPNAADLVVTSQSGSSAVQVVNARPVRDGQVQIQPHSHVKEKIGTAPANPEKSDSAIKATETRHDHRSFHKHY